VLVAKIVLAPTFVMSASVAARRYGARIGGLVGGLPVVAGPILLVFALDHGRAFAADASAATLLGIVSLIAFIVVYSRLAASAHWGASLILGWGGFFALTAALSAISVSAPAALACVLGAVALGLLALPRVSPAARLGETTAPVWDLPLRGLSALALVLALTALAGQLGAKLSGLLAPFPVIASVLAVFTHAQHGDQDVVRIMRGFVTGLVAYALFCFALAETLRSMSIAAGFAIAIAAALAAQATALALSWHRSRETGATSDGTASETDVQTAAVATAAAESS
jgi:hypothetical protein